MNRPAATRLLFLASMVCASAAFAGNDINKCVLPSGQMTLTDAECPAEAQTVKVGNGADGDETSPADTVVRASGTEHFKLPRMPLRSAALVRNTPPARGLSLDVATLKAARANMVLVDAHAQAMRSQRLAGLQ